jgi:biotin operon repressor
MIELVPEATELHISSTAVQKKLEIMTLDGVPQITVKKHLRHLAQWTDCIL